MRNSIIKSIFLTGFTIITVSASAQYLSMREERPKIDKSTKNLFQVSVNQETASNLNFRIVVNNPAQELLNVNLKNQNGQLFQDDIFHRRPNYSMLLGLEKLEDGIYTLSITTNYESFTKNFVITTEELGTRNGQMFLDRKVEILDTK
ncbi:hypothetical protein VB796_14370 [Arcicella sp. LKC2W]|uniref:hypothetical protein n=1 Tax=Arcicella sp. LKC2W TaxID=2984198 RepID=UPI002B218AD5|nr:hypothetical protein [Arcicella sp. LKC2W]MEA5460238.1 hypothetical protein [Arcicella sp. LKC2W]